MQSVRPRPRVVFLGLVRFCVCFNLTSFNLRNHVRNVLPAAKACGGKRSQDKYCTARLRETDRQYVDEERGAGGSAGWQRWSGQSTTRARSAHDVRYAAECRRMDASSAA